MALQHQRIGTCQTRLISRIIQAIYRGGHADIHRTHFRAARPAFASCAVQFTFASIRVHSRALLLPRTTRPQADEPADQDYFASLMSMPRTLATGRSFSLLGWFFTTNFSPSRRTMTELPPPSRLRARSQ